MTFLAYLAIGVFRYPDSILRPRLVYLFFRGLQQHVGLLVAGGLGV